MFGSGLGEFGITRSKNWAELLSWVEKVGGFSEKLGRKRSEFTDIVLI